jgi:dihydrofolate reductase
MAKLIYAAITSLDGYVADADGNFEWAAPDAEAHAYVNELERPIGTYLYGRRMYDVMQYWATAPTEGEGSREELDYAALWQATDKVVYSRTLTEVTTPRTRLERAFDPEAVRRLKAESDRDLGIGGPGLAAEALRAGLVDECHVFLQPVVVGGGTGWLPDKITIELELLGERRFGSGLVHLHHRIRT